MVLAHLLGMGASQLAKLGQRHPLLREEDVVLFGFDDLTGWIDPVETEWLERSAITRYSKAQVQADPVVTAQGAMDYLQRRGDSVLVHFDIDATNTPAVDVAHPDGLDISTAFTALNCFAASSSVAGIVVTELNAELDPDGAHASTLVRGLVDALAR
jgi:arginase